MRICIILTILLTLVGCSRKPATEHHILPNGFSGLYKIEKTTGDNAGDRVEGNRYVLAIPESGVLPVSSDVFETICRQCNKLLSVTFEDGREIPLFSPIKRPPGSELNDPMWLGLLESSDAIWCAVGTHDQLSRFLENFWAEPFQNLEQYLPPNMPFQTQE